MLRNPEQDLSLVHVDPASEEAVVTMIATMFNPFAVMSPEVLWDNVRLACSEGSPKKERTIRAELANYLVTRSCLFIMGLVVDSEFRKMVHEAVSMEIALDEESSDFVEGIRADFAKDQPEIKSKGNFVIDLSRYNDSVYKSMTSRLSASMEKGAAFDDEMAAASRALTENERAEIGFIACNFMYLFRAFSQNPVFASCVKDAFGMVQKSLELSF